MNVRSALEEAGYAWEQVPQRHPTLPIANAMRVGNIVYVSGQVSFNDEMGVRITGKVGADVDLENAQLAAELAALNCLYAVSPFVEPEDIQGVVMMNVFVNVAPGFNQMPAVANGASNFLERVLGEAGLSARAAIGVAELPMDAAVEITMVIEVR